MKRILIALLIVSLAIPAIAFDISEVVLDGQVRMRGYKIKDIGDFDQTDNKDNRSMFRLKTSLGLLIPVEENISAYIKLSNQNYGEGVGAEEGKHNYFFVENAYIDIKDIFELPVDIRLGRQNLMYGQGFIIFDGQSQTGSTSMYFDALKACWKINDNISLDLFYAKDDEGNVINEKDEDINITGLYLTIKECKLLGSKDELYILNKQEEKAGGDKDLLIYGLRISDKDISNFDYSVELAIQTGESSLTMDKDALGYKLDLGYTFKEVSAKPRLFAGYVSLSGDEAGSTTDDESWDVVYGGWPQFGDGLAWNFALNNQGYANYSDMKMWTLGASATLFEKLYTKLSYSVIEEEEDNGAVGNDVDYIQLYVKYPYSEKLSFAVYAAQLDSDKANSDKGTEFFWEANLNF